MFFEYFLIGCLITTGLICGWRLAEYITNREWRGK
jgi:hypothetical protein